MRNLLGWFFLTVMVGGLCFVAAIVTLVGLPYYLTSVDLRPEHALDPIYRSGGIVGLLLGIVGTALMVVLLLYSVRKWLPFLSFMGSSQFWMRFHLVAGLLGPLYIVLHGSLKMPTGFIGIGFWCMVLVALSGFFGRYLFGYFPATAHGMRLDLETEQKKLADLRARLVADTREARADQVAEAVRLAQNVTFEPRSLGELIVLDADVRRRADLIRIMLHRANLPPATRKKAEKTLVSQLVARRNMAGFDVARRLLRYWNLLHQPLALAMYLISAIHILNAIVFGGALQTLFGGI
ncbi:MAG: hypothetical protein H6735_06620 [Alphaproteobacteria bacterium]|nr:hypothetical protein [Alphaproteobacteria bacterium]